MAGLDTIISQIMAEAKEIAGFAAFLERYKKALPVERLAT